MTRDPSQGRAVENEGIVGMVRLHFTSRGERGWVGRLSHGSGVEGVGKGTFCSRQVEVGYIWNICSKSLLP